MNDAALGIKPGHGSLDGAILPGGINTLQNYEQSPAVRHIEALLEVGHTLGVRESDPLSRVFFEAAGLGRVVVGQLEALGIIDPEALDESS
jgi:hypothetical protein